MQANKSYRVYYEDGLFVPFEPVSIPKGSQAVVTILDFLGDYTEGSAESNALHPLISGDSPAILRKASPSKSAVGLWDGEITIPEDFNEPLEDLKEYMI